MKTEAQLQRYLRDEARRIGGTFDKLESRSRRGFPDCLILHKRVCWFVELKAPTGKGALSKLQRVVIADLRKHGANVLIIDSKQGVDDFINAVAGS